MTGFGEGTNDFIRHVIHECLLMMMMILLVVESGGHQLRELASTSPQIVTKIDLYYNSWDDAESTTLSNPTMKNLSDGNNYSETEDFSSESSTWRLLPIQIPNNLVSNAILQKDKVSSSRVQPYPGSQAPQYMLQPRGTEAQFLYLHERSHHIYDRDHVTLMPDNHDWDSKGTVNGHSILELQKQWIKHNAESKQMNTKADKNDWDRHDAERFRDIPETQERSNQDLRNIENHHISSAPQRYSWDIHKSGIDHDIPKLQQNYWNHFGTDNTHSYPETQQQNLNNYNNEMDDSSPVLQQQTWDHYNTESKHNNPEPQYNWNHYATEDIYRNQQKQSLNHSKTESDHRPQHQNMNYHDTESDHSIREQDSKWIHQGIEKVHWNPESERQEWSLYSVDRTSPHGPSSHNNLLNKTYTSDGYNIRNHHMEENFNSGPSKNLNYHHSFRPHSVSSWNWNLQDAQYRQQGIIEKLSQYLPRFPALPKLRHLGLANLPSFIKFPEWIFGERIHQNGAKEPPQTNGKYVHKFYPLVSENNPLEHLSMNPERYHKPLYTYPPTHDHTEQPNTLDIPHKTEFTRDETPYLQNYNHIADDTQITPQLQDFNNLHNNQDNRQQSRIAQQEPYAYHLPHETSNIHSTFHSHNRPQRILKIPQQQGYTGHSEHHSTPHNWYNLGWKEQEDRPIHPNQKIRDPYTRKPSSDQNWIYHEQVNAGSGHVPSISTQDQVYRHTYKTHTQHPYQYDLSYGYTQHQHNQQQESNIRYSESTQFQPGFGADFNFNTHDNILDPLSNLVSRPSALSIIKTSPYQQNIMERLTGVDTSATSSLVIPGGLLVLGLALGLFYFNFVWYPTPVVTAKIFKMISDSASDGKLSEGQQRAVGEVYRVFQSLEAEYKHNPSALSLSCRRRLVCQVHQELPGLWRVTQVYAALVLPSLTHDPEGDSDFTGYQEAAYHGYQNDNCSALYHKCHQRPVQLMATLQKLFALFVTE